MPDQKLTALTALATLSADDLFYVVDDPAGAATSKKLATSVLDARFASAAQGALAATALQAANNLSDVASVATARTNLGLVAGGAGDIWVEKAGDTMTGLLTYAQPSTVDAKFYCVNPADANARLFNWFIWTSDNVGSLRDNVGINWGYNQAAGGGPEDNTEPSFYQQIETYYKPGSTSQFEYHWDFFLSGGADPGVRPMHLNCVHDTGDIDFYWFGDIHEWAAAHDGQFGLMALVAGANAAASVFDVYIPSDHHGLISFTGTTHAGIQLNSLTTTQRNALTAANGMLIYNSTDSRMQGRISAAWADIYSAGGTDVAIADGGTGQSTAQAAIDALSNVAAATNEHVLTKDTATGNAIFKAAAGGGGSPGGADTQVQFNDGGAFGGDAQLVWNKTSNLLTVTGTQIINANSTAALLVEQDGVKDNVLVVNTTAARIGLNVASPSAILHVHGNSNDDDLILFSRPNGSSLMNLTYGGDGPIWLAASGENVEFRGGSSAGKFLKFRTMNSSGYTRFSNFDDYTVMQIDASRNISIGHGVTPSGKLHIKVDDAEAVPVLYAQQNDIDQPMIQFDTTIGTGNAIEAVGAKTLTVTHFIMVKLPGGLTRYFPVGTIA